MSTDLGSLSLGLAVVTTPLDLLEARLAAMDRMAYTAHVGVDTSAVTQAEAQLASLNSAQQALGGTATKIAVDAQEVDKAGLSIANVRSGLAGMRGDAIGAASGFEAFGPAALGVAAVGAVLAIAATEAAKFQQSLAGVQAVLHASNDDLGKLGASIQQNSRDTVFTANQIAEADRQLAKAGQDANQIIAEQRDVLNLSAAAQVSASEGATAYVTAMKDFNLTASDSRAIADDLAKSTDSSVGTLADMALALQQVGPVAQQAGLDLKTTTAAIADLENAGLQGDAGSALKIFLTRLESPTTAAKSAMDSLGLSVYDTNGQLLSMSAIFDQIQQKTRGLDDETKNQALTQIFGARGVRVADIASAQGSSGLQDIIAHENQIGDASEIAATKLATLTGQVHQLESSLNSVAVNIGQVAIPALTTYAASITDLLNLAAKATSLLGGGGGSSGAGFQAAFTFTGDDQGSLARQQAYIDGLKKQQQDLVDTQGGITGRAGEIASNIGVGFIRPLGFLNTNQKQYDDLTASINQATAARDRFKASMADEPTTALSAVNSDIATILNDQQSRDARSGDNIAAIGQHAEDAKKYVDSFKDSFISSGHSIQDWQAIETAAFQDIDSRAQQTKSALEEAAVLLTQQNRDLEAQRAILLGEGAPERLVNTALFGEDFGLTKQQIADANTELKKWEATYAEAQKANAAEDANQAAYAKQLDADVATARQQHLNDIVSAAKSAQSAIASVSLANGGLDSLSSAAAGLDKVQSDLAALGQDTSALSGLTAIADQFKAISDAEDRATKAYKGYLLTLDQSDAGVQQAEALKQRYDAAADAADKAIKAGTATDQQRQISAGRTVFDANIDAQIAGLQRNGAGDLLAAVKVAPDFTGWDDKIRAAVQQQGGGQALIEKVGADTTAATAALHAIEIAPHDTTLTVHVQYTMPDGTPINAAQIDNPGGYASNQDGGYARPTTIQSVGGGPYGNGTLAQGGVGGASTQTPRGDASNLMPYADLIQQAANAYGVPAWVLGAIIEHESGGVVGKVENGGGLGRGLTQVDIGQNPQYDASRLTGTSRDDAAYQINSGAQILAAMIQQYGPTQGIQRYAGPAYQSQAGGGVPAGLDLPTELNQYYRPGVDAALGSGTGGSPDAAASSARDKIVALALQSVGTDKLVNYCEQFVEETVQAITGKRGATGQNENNATQAFQHAQAMGLEIPASQAQLGDLVYYPDANGGPGHVTVYKGKGEQISTYDGRPTPNGDQYAVHTEAVAPGARYISVGLPAASAPSTAATGYGPGTYNATGGVGVGTSDLTNPSSPAAIAALAQQAQDAKDLATSLSNIQVAAGQVNRAFAGMNPPEIKAAQSEFTSMLPVFQKMQDAGLSASASVADKQLATNAATGQALEYEAAWSQLVKDIKSGTGSILDDTNKIASIVSGPMASGYAAAALASATMAANTADIARLQKEQTAADAAQQQVVAARTQADTAASRLQTIKGWGQQFLQEQLADRQTAENAAYTQTQRDEQDTQRRLQFSQQVQATDLQNRLTDLQKSQQDATYNRTSAEQLQAATVKGAGTNTQAASAAATLATMHDRDLAQKDLNTKAIDDIQLQIREQAKQANLESYNLETETIAAQRVHENKMTGYAAEGTALSRNAEAQSRADTIAQWRLQDSRAAEDLKYTTEKTANAAAQTADRAKITAAQSELDLANQALGVFTDTGAVIGNIGLTAQQQYNVQTAGLSTAHGVPYSQFPAPGQSHATGGSVSGWGIVGDSPSGDMTNAEAVFGAYTVVPHDQSVRAGLISGASGGSTAPAMTVNLNLGDVGLMLSDADKREINDLIAAKINAARKAGINLSRALGR